MYKFEVQRFSLASALYGADSLCRHPLQRHQGDLLVQEAHVSLVQLYCVQARRLR